MRVIRKTAIDGGSERAFVLRHLGPGVVDHL
jgi:hypothetical protein